MILHLTRIHLYLCLDEDFKFCMGQVEIPKIFCSTRKLLGNLLISDSARIGIVGILKFDGVFEVWNQIIEDLKHLQDSWIERVVTVKDNDDLHKSIWWSSYYGHVEVLEKLNETNHDQFNSQINRGNPEFMGKTPLIIAVERNHLQTVKFLLKNGADQDIPDFAMNRPVHLIKSAEMAEYFDFSILSVALIKNAAGFTPIETAIVAENLEVLQVICEQNIHVIEDQKNKHLFLSTRNRNFKVINFLLNKFYKKNLFEKELYPENGNSLLMESVQNNSYEVFKYLVSKTAIDFDYVNYNSETIWDICQKNQNIGIKRYLEKRKRNTNIN